MIRVAHSYNTGNWNLFLYNQKENEKGEKNLRSQIGKFRKCETKKAIA
jgi:hypothetical protein